MIHAKILVVDDDVLVAQNIDTWLKRFGYNVIALVSSAEAALNHIAQNKPDLILMDINLEGEMDGIEAAQHIHTLYDIPVVFISAFADTETIQRALLTEPYGYVLKPFNVRQLRSTIEMALLRYEKERKVKEREKRFSTIAAYSHDWEYWIGPDGSLLYISPSCIRITGYSPEEFIAKPELLSDIVHPQDREAVNKHHLEVRTEPDSYSMEYRIIARSGEEKWISHSCQAVYSGAGKWLGRRGSNRDITASKQAEREIILQGRFFRKIIDATPNMVSVRDAKGRFVMANRALVDFFGTTQEEILDKHIADLFSEQRDAEQGQETDQQVIMTQETISYNTNYTSSDGRRLWFVATKTPLAQADSTTYVLEVDTDITDIRQANVELSRVEDRFSKAIHISPLPTILSGLSDGIIMDINQKFLDLSGFTYRECIGHTLLELGILTKETYQHLDLSLKENKSISEVGVTFYNKKGEAHPGLIRLGFVEIGDELCVLSEFYDLTNQKQAELIRRQQALTFESVFDAIIFTNEHSQIIDWNPAAVEIFGYTKDEVLGKSPNIIQAPNNIPGLQQDIVKTVLQGERWTGKVNFIRKDGATGVVDVIVVPLEDEEGKIIATIGINRDITER